MTAIATPGSARRYTPAGRYDLKSGPVVLTGVQAIARALIAARARDEQAGHRTAAFVAGYQGSPLGGLDTLLADIKGLRDNHGIHLSPGVNEELAATAVWGTQQELPAGTRSVDGVIGVWYGKGPGLDRASDAIRHANLYGVDPRGGAIAYVGDDPGCKSSTLPFVSDATLAALNMPYFVPRNAEEVIEHTLYAIQLSRFSGCWVGVKVVADVADGLWTVDRDFLSLAIAIPDVEWEGKPWSYRRRPVHTPGESLLVEADLVGPRWEAVRALLDANDLDKVIGPTDRAAIGIVSSGISFDAVHQALSDLGLTEAELASAGIRLMRVAAPYPLSPRPIIDFALGLDQVLVVEEKTTVLESQVREILYGSGSRPEIWGRNDPGGRRLIPADGKLVASRLYGPLQRLLADRVELKSPLTRTALSVLPVHRTPYFCSGCPHNRSTTVPDGSLAAGGIGCHTLASVSARPDDAITGWTQMGGEGAQWIGQSAFTSERHIFQNIGDGTLFHSGQLAIQAAIAAGVNITYKILYNAAVAMTGAQEPQAGLAVPALVRKLSAEGVRQIIICADEPERYGKVRLPRDVKLWPRERLDEAQRVLREVEGVTVLIYDQRCAANARRLRKRGILPERTIRVVINEAVCEGCGDCGAKSNCLSVRPIDTEFGRKTKIDQTSCNTDYSCLEGDCPSFVTVETAPRKSSRPKVKRRKITPPSVPPVDVSPANTNIFLAGIGGTGILTVNQLLATAAQRSGYSIAGLDQTGLSQKAGPVVSHLRLTRADAQPSNRLSEGTADLILAFDLLVGADERYAKYADPARTSVVASTSSTPTGDMVADPAVSEPDQAMLLDRIRSQAQRVDTVDALALSERVLGDTTAANLVLVGLAFQRGELPIPASEIEEAIRLNGVAVEDNLAAFAWGRAVAVDPGRAPSEKARTREGHSAWPLDGSPLRGETRRLAELRAEQLLAYQGPRCARSYIALVERVWNAERTVGETTSFSEAVARYLYKLTAYKDEYEVARLLTDRTFVADVQGEVPGSTTLTYQLHPPALRSLGMKRKLRLGPWARPALRVLAAGKVLRGTRLDPFGYTHMRRLERRLLEDYSAMVSTLADTLTATSYARAVALAEAPDVIRGYEDVKLRNVERYQALLAQHGAGPAAAYVPD